MRKITTFAALIAFGLGIAAPAVATAALQEQEPEEQTLEGTLQAVDLAAMNITVADSMGDESTVTVTEDTTVAGPDGPMTVADLAGKEGAEIIVHCVDGDENLQALSIELVA